MSTKDNPVSNGGSSYGQGRDENSKLSQFILKVPSINFPKGGGAIKGIGEKFAANPVTGTGSMTVPIATSHAQNDSGMFELNFRDERFLPFEGAGAVSTWRLEMPDSFRQFNYETISDVILHIKYTAKDGGQNFRGKVEEILKEILNVAVLAANRSGLYKAFSLKHDFPNEWYRFKNDKTVKLKIDKERLPYPVQKYDMVFNNVDWISGVKLDVKVDGGAFQFDKFSSHGVNFSFYKGSKNFDLKQEITLSSAAGLDTLEDLVILIKYSL